MTPVVYVHGPLSKVATNYVHVIMFLDAALMPTSVQSWTSATQLILTTRELRCGGWPGTSLAQYWHRQEMTAASDCGKVIGLFNCTNVLSNLHHLSEPAEPTTIITSK